MLGGLRGRDAKRRKLVGHEEQVNDVDVEGAAQTSQGSGIVDDAAHELRIGAASSGLTRGPCRREPQAVLDSPQVGAGNRTESAQRSRAALVRETATPPTKTVFRHSTRFSRVRPRCVV
jgi:hypothetical protein